MTSFLRPGRLEVETDLLLGVEDVLLPAGFERASAEVAPQAAATRPTSSVVRQGFDAALFEAKPGRAPVAGASPPPMRTPEASGSRSPQDAPARVGASMRGETGGASSAPVRVAAPLADSVVSPTGGTRAERLGALEAAHARDCPHCTKATGHNLLVFGEGNPDAELMFVGEAPGETEDIQGRPFVGRAGEKLDEMIRAMGFAREEVYIANVLKARPPENRTPLAHEVERCGPYLLAQISIIRPKAIVALGGPAAKLLLASDLGITRLRGVFGALTAGRADGSPFEVPVMPTFHPAYLLRNYTVETRAQMWSDLKLVLEHLGRSAPRAAKSAPHAAS